MRTIRQKNNIKIGILVLAIGLMSIAFATFSSNLSIKSSTTVSPNSDNFQVLASASETSTSDNNITPRIGKLGAYAETVPLTQTGSIAVIENGTKKITISNVSMTLDTPGQEIDYEFYLHNTGKYKVYLKRYYEDNSTKKCTPLEGTDTELTKKVCSKIYMDWFFKNDQGWQWFSGDKKNIYLDPGDKMKIQIRFLYSPNDNVRTDGPFSIEFMNQGISFSTAMFE